MTTFFKLPDAYKDASPKDSQLSKKDLDELNLWLKHQNAPMIFFGLPGRGKTHTAAALYNMRQERLKEEIEKDPKARFDSPFHSVFCNLAELFHEYKLRLDDYSEINVLINELLFPRMLILDDLGIREPTKAFNDFLYLIIDKRTARKKDLTLITTNCNSKELSERYGDRISSRIATGYTIKFIGEDWRKKKRELLKADG